MAVTINQQPLSGTFQASDTPIVYVFSSNQTTQPNFSFVVETLINNAVVSVDMVFPEKGNRAHFDAKKITTAAIRPVGRTSDVYVGQILPTLKIRVAERYGTTPTTQTPVTSNTCKLVKACTDDETFAMYMAGGLDGWCAMAYIPSFVWLTDAPKDVESNTRIYASRKAPIRASILNTDPAITWGISFLNSEGTTIATYTEGPYEPADRVYLFLEPYFLNDILSGYSLTLEDVTEMRIEMNTSYSYVVQFVDLECGDFHQLTWLNNLGYYDQFLFTHNREQEAAVTGLEYKRQFGGWVPGNFYTFDDTISGDTAYVKMVQPTGTLYSGYIAQEYKRWLNTVLFSVDTLLYRNLDETGISTGFGANNIEKIVVTDAKAVEDKSRFEDLINFQVSYKKSNFKSINI